jgi:tetratricopeptide (TPR) repeat protein
MGLVHYQLVHDQIEGDYRRALDEFTIALKGLPGDAEVWFWVGATQRRLGNWDKVLEAFDQAARLDPRGADMFRNLGGMTYQFLHRYADAVRAYDRAVSLAPDLHDAAFSRAQTLLAWQGDLDTLRQAVERMPKGSRLGFSDVDARRAELLLLEREADDLLAMPGVERGDVFLLDHNVSRPAALYAGWAYQLRGNQAMARAAFDAARLRSDSDLSRYPDDWTGHAARGLALAGLGRREEALREARWLQQSARYREDAFSGPMLAEDRARILAQAGDAEAALDEIDRLLGGPSFLSVHTLQLDPRWDPIRHHPRFKALLAKYGAAAVR